MVMIIKDFKGKKYNHSKLLKFFDNVNLKIEKIEDENQKRWDDYKKRIATMTNDQKAKEPLPKMVGYCTFCGAKRPSGDIGIGGGCEQITDAFKDGYIDLFYKEKKEEWQSDLFLAYKKYARYVRALFLFHNQNPKNKFLISFKKSIETTEKISRKQLEVMEKNATFNNYMEKLENYKKYVYCKFGYFNKNLFYINLDFDKDFALYCQIQYAKAWM